MNDALISIIVPVYKVEPYIRQCVDSILAQTYRNLEIILIDDGSPDNCPQICDEYAQKDLRVHVIHQENGGQAKARNAALDIFRGDYVGFVDSDDWIEPNMFEKMLAEIQKQNLDAAFCTANIITGEKCTENRFAYFPDKTILSPEMMVKLSLTDEIGGQPCLRLMKRKCWEKVRFPEGRLYEDLAISYQPFLYADHGIIFLQDALYNYRMNPNGTSLKFNPQKGFYIFLGFRDHYDYAKQRCAEVLDVTMAKTAKSALSYCSVNIIWGLKQYKDCMDEAASWLKKHRNEIMTRPSINPLIKLGIILYFFSPKFCAKAYATYKKVKKDS